LSILKVSFLPAGESAGAHREEGQFSDVLPRTCRTRAQRVRRSSAVPASYGIETETIGLHRAHGPNSRRVLLLG